MAWVDQLRTQMPTQQACTALPVPRSWYYRARQTETQRANAQPPVRPKPTHALSETEKQTVRGTLNSMRFQDQTPRTVYATLLDEGTYLCHWRTMYRILDEHDEVRERRAVRERAKPSRPQLVARGINQVWSWDITRLQGVGRGVSYYLYVMLDVFSRFVVGWMLADRENQALGTHFVATTCDQHTIAPEQLTIHSDRGNPMRAGTMAELLTQLGVTQSFARPRTPNDNPYSEAQFKTMKYRPTYPECFDDRDAAHAWAKQFFRWYNHDHYHVALGLMTPAMVHHGQVEEVRTHRQRVLDAAYAATPHRFPGGRPRAAVPASEVWINAPSDGDLTFSAPALSADEPGAQAGSRVGSAALDAAEHLATIDNGREAIISVKSTPFENSKLSHSS